MGRLYTGTGSTIQIRWPLLEDFIAITFALLDQADEDQVRYHEQAQIEATWAPPGEVIVWQSGAASRSVFALREGVDVRGFVCRES